MISKTAFVICPTKDIPKIENYFKAVNDEDNMWELHHRLEIQPDGTELSSQDLKDMQMYWHRPPEELIFMLRKDHRNLHRTSKLGRMATKKGVATRLRKPKKEKPQKVRKERITRWQKLLSGKSREEKIAILDSLNLDNGYVSRIRKQFDCVLTKEEIQKRYSEAQKRYSEALKLKSSQTQMKITVEERNEILQIILDGKTKPSLRKKLCNRIGLDYTKVNTKLKRQAYSE